MVATAGQVGDQPAVADLIGSVKVMMDAYEEGKIDSLFVVYNHFVNTMTQQLKVQQLLPLPKDHEDDLSVKLGTHWDYIYEPDAREVLDALLVRYLESLVYQSVVENLACEQAARMVAMKAATDNAGQLIDELGLFTIRLVRQLLRKRFQKLLAAAAL